MIAVGTGARFRLRGPVLAAAAAVVLIGIGLGDDWFRGWPAAMSAGHGLDALVRLMLWAGFLLLLYAVITLLRLSLFNPRTADLRSSSGDTPPDPFSLLQTVLAELVAAPESKLAFWRLLAEVESVMGGSASALFISRERGHYESVAGTSDEFVNCCAELLTKKTLDNPPRSETLRIVQMPGERESRIAIATLDTRIEGGRGCLLLKLPARQVENTSNTALKVLGEGLGAILGAIICSAERAQTDRKLALYQERAVIARELHDSLAQSISYLRIQVSRLQSVLELNRPEVEIDRARADSMLQEIRTQLNLAHRQLREIITTFRLTMNGGSFHQALQASISEFESRSGIAFSIDNRLSDGTLTVDREMHVLQIVREALTNVVRHSHARVAHVSLRELPDGEVNIAVDDDGIGASAVGQKEQHHGLVIMQQRAHELGETLP